MTGKDDNTKRDLPLEDQKNSGDQSDRPGTEFFASLNKLLEGFRAYPVLLLGVLISYEKLHKDSGITNPYLFLLVIGGPLLLTFVFHSLPTWRQNRRNRALQKLGIRGHLTDTVYFRLRPYDENDKAFRRPDGLEDQILQWIRDSQNTILFLTGDSGTGKSSLLQASVLPRLQRDQPQFCILNARFTGNTSSNIFTSLHRVLLEPGRIWRRPPTEQHDLATLILQASDHLRTKSQSLLILFDQFEDFLLFGSPEEKTTFKTLIQSLRGTQISNLKILLVCRRDSIELFKDFDLPWLQQCHNWEQVGPFTESDAIQFLENSGLEIGAILKQKILEEAREVEETRGRIRPITINLFGLTLRQFRGQLPHAYAPGALLRSYLRDIVNRPDLRLYAPRILAAMISRSGKKWPRTQDDLAETLHLDPSLVRGCLIHLGNEGLVRELDSSSGTWEISHDFVARLLHYVLAGWRINLWRRLQPLTPILAVAGWLLIPLLIMPAYHSKQMLTVRQQLDALEITHRETPDSQGLQVTITSPDPTRLRNAIAILKRWPGPIHLTISKMALPELSVLGDLTNVRTLDLTSDAIPDTSFVSKLTNLHHLTLANNQIKNIHFLSGLQNLEILDLGFNQISDISPLSTLHNLQFLNLESNKISSVKALHDLVSVRRLDISNNNLDDLTGLDGLTSLEVLKLNFNKGLPSLKVINHLLRLRVFEFGHNTTIQITGIESLQNLQIIGLGFNLELGDITPLYHMPNLRCVDLQGSPPTLKSSLQQTRPDIQVVSANSCTGIPLPDEKPPLISQ